MRIWRSKQVRKYKEDNIEIDLFKNQGNWRDWNWTSKVIN